MLAVWLGFGAALCAIGGLFFHRAGHIDSTPEYLYYSIWAGLALLVLALHVWHFFLPLDEYVQVAFGVVSALALIFERRWFRPLLSARANAPFALCTLVLVAWVANHALGPGGMDDYNYEYQAIRWFHDYPLVPGLANIHGRLGFNNSHHVVAALLGAGPWQGRVNHLLNGFVVSLALVYVLFGLFSVVKMRGRASSVRICAALLFAPAIGLVLFGNFGPAISTLKADVFVSAGMIVLSCVFLRFASSTKGTSDYRVSAATAILLGCVLAAVKLSAATYCGVIVLAVLVRVARDGCVHPREKLVAGSVAAGALLAATFVARGAFLSGYALYPSTAFPFDVDWRVPTAQADGDRLFIKTWSQLFPTYDAALAASHQWFPAWLHSVLLTEKLTILLPLAALAILLTAYPAGGRSRTGEERRWALHVLMAASTLALVVWFTQAPAARFASVYFWITLAALAIRTVADRTQPIARGALAFTAFAVVAGLWMLLTYAHVDVQHWPGVFGAVTLGLAWAIACSNVPRQPSLLAVLCVVLGFAQIAERTGAHLLRGRVRDAGAMLWYDVTALPPEPQFEQTVRETRTGVVIYASTWSSFHTPIPNTRYFNPWLELRDPSDVRRGFRNPAGAVNSYGYSVDYVMQPGGWAEIVVPK